MSIFIDRELVHKLFVAINFKKTPKEFVFLSITIALISSVCVYCEPRSLDEVRAHYFGVDPLHPSADSALGRYIQETGATSLIRRFLTAPPGSTNPPSELGPERLVVAVSEKSHDALFRYFSESNLLGQMHTPNQSTLNIVFRKQAGSYALVGGRPVRNQNAGSLWFPLIFSDLEAVRLEDYFRLRFYEIGQLINDEADPYGPVNGWGGCTYWFGEIPVGLTRVESYSVAAGPTDSDGSHPRQKSLVPYTRPRNQVTLPPWELPLYRKVWAVPGYQMLSDLLGLSQNDFRGEFANPGWLAYTMSGAVSASRLPVVFRYQVNHQEVIPPDFSIEANPSLVRASHQKIGEK